MADVEVSIRPLRESDRNFVASSWKRSHHDHVSSQRVISKQRFFDRMNPLVDSLIAECETLVACDPEDEDTIYGWICFERATPTVPVVHYAYVKEDVRRFGVATALFQAANPNGHDTLCTHDGKHLARLILNGWPLALDESYLSRRHT